MLQKKNVFFLLFASFLVKYCTRSPVRPQTRSQPVWVTSRHGFILRGHKLSRVLFTFTTLNHTQCLCHIQCAWCSGVTKSRGNLNQKAAGKAGERSHETSFPRGLPVTRRAHTDPREAIFFPFPEKVTVGDVK